MWRLLTLPVAFAFLTLGCARRDEPALPDVDVVLTTDEEPGLDPNAEVEQPMAVLELLSEEELFPPNVHVELPPTERLDDAVEREISSAPFWLAEFPDVQWPDSQWFPRPDEPEWEVPGCAVNFMSFPSRRGAFKSRLLRELGGTDESERAVALGLKWLARQQQEDGGWQFDAGAKDERVAATGLALLAFLGAGESHELGVVYTPPACQLCLPMPEKVTLVYSKHGMYCRTVRRGLDFLLKNCPLSGPNSGRMSWNPYAHAIGTLALCEAYAMTRDQRLQAPAQAAIYHIARMQAPNGSWGYAPRMNGDISIVGWQIQAFHAASYAKDLVVPKATLTRAVDFLTSASAGSRKAMYGYTDTTGAAPATNLTAVGLLCRHHIDNWTADTPGMAEGVTGLMKRVPVKSPHMPPIYFYYHASQVVRFYEGSEWKDWNEGPKGPDGIRKGGMRDWLVSLQVKADGEKQGSFDPDNDWIGRSCGRLGMTAMCVLTLEVYYRYPLLPVAPPK